MAVEDEPVGGKEACWGCPLWGCPNLTLPPLDILRLLSCKRIKESKSGVSGIETLGGTCCNNSFIRGTKLTGFPPTPPLLRLVEAGWRSWPPFFCELEAAATLAEEAEEAGGGCRGRPDGVANGGADKIDVNEGAEAASEDIFGLCC